MLGVGTEFLSLPAVLLGGCDAPRGLLACWFGKGSLGDISPAGDEVPEYVMAGPLVIDPSLRGIARGRAVVELIDAWRFAAMAQGITSCLVRAGSPEMRRIARRVSTWPEVGLRLLSQHGDIDLYCWDLCPLEATDVPLIEINSGYAA